MQYVNQILLFFSGAIIQTDYASTHDNHLDAQYERPQEFPFKVTTISERIRKEGGR